MTKGRLIGLGIVLVAVFALALSSYLRFSNDATDPGPPSPLVAESGGVSGSGPRSASELVEFWRARVDRSPSSYIDYTELGAALIREARETGDVSGYSRAEAALERALELNPKYEAAISYLATVLYAKHDFASALELAERVYSFDPGAAQALAVLGDAHLELGGYSEAELAYERLLELSQTPPVYSRLARLTELKGSPQAAIEVLSRAAAEADAGVGSRESMAWYHLQLGRVYFNVGEIGPAEEEYERALETFPDYVHALAGLAKVHAARGDYDDAASLYDRVVARYPIPEYVAALGDVHLVAGREDEAEKQYDLLAAIDELYKANGVNTDLQMALFFADHDLNIDEAVRQARGVYEERPSIQAADVLAWALYKSGQYEEARAYSQEALRLGTQDALMLFHAGMIYDRLDEYEKARDHLERAIEINPGFSVLYAGTAADTLQELQSVVRR